MKNYDDLFEHLGKLLKPLDDHGLAGLMHYKIDADEYEVTLCGIDLFVMATFNKGEESDRDTCGTPDTLTIEDVFVAGTEWNVTDSLNKFETEKIEELIIEKYHR